MDKNFEDSIAIYRDLLLKTNNSQLKAQCLNNLAMAMWFRHLSTNKNELDAKTANEIDTDYQNVLSLLKKAIYYSEGNIIRHRYGIAQRQVFIRGEIQ